VSTTPTIVAIANDPALLRSLAFALEAHGHQVRAYSARSAAGECLSEAACVIVDGRLALSDLKRIVEQAAAKTKVMILADDDTMSFGRRDVLLLRKPLDGPDVLSALSTLL
jgi:hypothetical protein